LQSLPAAEASILKLHTKPVLSYQVPIFGTWPQNISAAEKIEFVLFRRIMSLNPGCSQARAGSDRPSFFTHGFHGYVLLCVSIFRRGSIIFLCVSLCVCVFELLKGEIRPLYQRNAAASLVRGVGAVLSAALTPAPDCGVGAAPLELSLVLADEEGHVGSRLGFSGIGASE
jgi:hypothetical protein